MKDLLDSAFGNASHEAENTTLATVDGGGGGIRGEESRGCGLVRWLEVWFMLVGSVVDIVSL